MTHTHKEHGYTLLELLLYVAIVGSLLTSITYFFGLMTDARVKNQSIAEVNDQGVAIMDYLAQTVRNASSITSPATGAVGTFLTLAVPTGSLSPTIFDISGTSMGYATDGGSTDSSNSNFINATKFTANASGTIATLYGLAGPTVATAPNNLSQMALYSGASAPTTLLASSASVPLVSNTWNAFSISPVSVTSGQTYWLAYNTNGLAVGDNDLRYHTGTAGQGQFIAQTFGTWPSSWTGTAQNLEYSVFAPIEVAASPSAIRVKEGAGAVVPLSSSDVQVTGLTLKNLTRSGTPGAIQISFTVARVNPENRNEYEYRRVFTTTAEVGW
jgi:type II secretory pathway pseudopilin PulG